MKFQCFSVSTHTLENSQLLSCNRERESVTEQNPVHANIMHA